MAKYYLRYLVFLLPALLVTIFQNILDNFTGNNTIIVIQWFFAFFMLIGFGVTTAAAAYHYPRGAMSFILGYIGVNLLIITALYRAEYETPLYYFLSDYAGALSYVPLDILVKAMIDFNIQQEVVITLIVSGCCLAGYASGLVHRRVNPNPYSPRIG